MRDIERTLEPIIPRAFREFPTAILTGPRHSGKTTRLKHLLAECHRYLSPELPDIQAAAANDPRG